MAGAGIIKAEFNESDIQEVIEALKKASAPVLRDIAESAGAELDYISKKKAFEKEQNPVTKEKWEPLKNPRPDGSTYLILHPDGREHGQLYRSLMWEAFDDGSVIYGSNVVYARIHQEGGLAGKLHRSLIPARPYMGVPYDFERYFLNDPNVLKHLGLYDLCEKNFGR